MRHCVCLVLSPQTIYGVLGGGVPGKHVRRVVAAYLGITEDEVTAWAAEASS